MLGLIFFLLYRGNYLGWRVSTPISVAAVAIAAGLALFVWRELVTPEPFMDLRGFAYRTVALTMLASAFWCASLYGVAIQLPNCLLLLGYEHWKTGWVILPMCLIVVATMFLGGFVSQRATLVWLLRIGLAGMTLVGLWLARVDIYTPWQWVMGTSSLWAVFAGMCMAPIAQLTFEGQPPEAAGATGRHEILHALLQRDGGHPAWPASCSTAPPRGGWNSSGTVSCRVRGPFRPTCPSSETTWCGTAARHQPRPLQADAVLGYWVNLHAQVIGYRRALRFCAYLSAAGLIVSCFIHRRKEISVFDTGLTVPTHRPVPNTSIDRETASTTA